MLRGVVCGDLAELVDIYPTLMDLCACDVPDSPHRPQGRSLTATLTDGRPVGRTYCISENGSQAAVITDRYKLGAWLAPHARGKPDYREWGDMLFDRQVDPLETRNVMAERPEVRALLMEHLLEWERGVPRA